MANIPFSICIFGIVSDVVGLILIVRAKGDWTDYAKLMELSQKTVDAMQRMAEASKALVELQSELA